MKTDSIEKRIVWLACCALAATVCAMPTKQQISQAQPLVNDLTAEDLRALKSKEKTSGDVAAAHLALADKAETEAGKYLLLQGAFRLYARGGDYDAAAVPLQRMRGEIAELPPEVIVEIVNKEMRRVASEKAPKVLAIFRDAQRTIKYRKQLASAELNATAHPENVRYQRSLAECHACLGDWPKAIEIFAKIGDEAAKWELGKAKDCDAAKAADFWWNYKAADVEPFKAHAASLYRAALDANQVSGLKREVAAKRLAEFEASGVPILAAATGGRTSAPTSGPWAIPTNFKTPLVRTLKLPDGVDMEFCACPAGTFEMSNVPGQEPRNHKVTITRPFWISRQFVTSRQNRAAGGTPVNDGLAQKLEKMFPEDDIVFRVKGHTVDVFINAMNERFGAGLPQGYVFRLPTEAELEYAVGAGGKYKNDTIYWNHTRKALISKGLLSEEEKNAKGVPKEYGRVLIFERFPVNPWKIIGGWTNAAQLTLDHVDVPKDVEWEGNPKKHLVYAKNEVDPLRSGNRWLKRQWNIGRWLRTARNDDIFRVVIGPDLVAEKKAEKNGAKAANPAPVPTPPTAHEAQSATPSAAATEPPPAKIKTHTIKLNNTVSMEFVECPAGTFTMGYEKDKYSPNREHKVTITRPFWIARTKLTLEQYKAYDKKFKPREEFLVDGDKSPLCATHLSKWDRRSNLRRQADAYCEYLTKKFRHAIPQGYVFRLPTDAEWEYAYTAGETNPNDFYGMSGNATKKLPLEEIEKYMITGKYIREYAAKAGKNYGKDYDATGVAVGQCKPNRWGLYDMAGNTCEMVLDTLDAKLLDTKSWYAGFGPKQTALVYKDEEVDPLRYIPMGSKNDGYGSLLKTVEMASRGGYGGKWLRTGFQHSFRIVVGPDLLKERGIKLPKSGK